ATGNPAWTYPLAGANHVVVEGARVVGGGRGELVALDRSTGVKLWTLQLGKDRYPTQPVAVGGLIIVAQDRGALMGVDLRTGAARELQEELGVRASIGGEYARVEHIYPDLQVELALYRCRLHAGEEPRPLACDQIRWVSRRDLPGLPFCEADVPILVRLAEEELS